MQPPNPRQQGDSPCTHPAKRKMVPSKLLSACWLGNEGKCAYDRKAHGRNENKEKAGRESSLSPPAFFYCFPRMQKHPVGGVSHRPARGRQCRSQLAKTQSSSVKACVRVALQHRHIACKIHIAISGTGSRGNAPCGVGRGNAPPSFPTHHRQIVCVIKQATSGKGSRALPW